MIIKSEYLQTREINEMKAISGSDNLFESNDSRQYNNDELIKNSFVKPVLKEKFENNLFNSIQTYELKNNNTEQINAIGYITIILSILLSLLIIKRFIK